MLYNIGSSATEGIVAAPFWRGRQSPRSASPLTRALPSREGSTQWAVASGGSPRSASYDADIRSPSDAADPLASLDSMFSDGMDPNGGDEFHLPFEADANQRTGKGGEESEKTIAALEAALEALRVEALNARHDSRLAILAAQEQRNERNEVAADLENELINLRTQLEELMEENHKLFEKKRVEVHAAEERGREAVAADVKARIAIAIKEYQLHARSAHVEEAVQTEASFLRQLDERVGAIHLVGPAQVCDAARASANRAVGNLRCVSAELLRRRVPRIRFTSARRPRFIVPCPSFVCRI